MNFVEFWVVLIIVALALIGLWLLGRRGAPPEAGVPVTGRAQANRFSIQARRSPKDASWLGARQDIAGLARLLRYEDVNHPQEAAQVRFAAAETLGELENPRAVEPLLRALTDDHSAVRAAAASALGKLGNPHRPLGMEGANEQIRTRILAGLFPLARRDPANEARWAAVESLYQVGGQDVLRPVLAGFRQRAAGRTETLAQQHWFVQWAAGCSLDSLLIDAYPWFAPPARREIVEVLRSRMTPRTLTRLSLARDSKDTDLEELAQEVLG